MFYYDPDILIFGIMFARPAYNKWGNKIRVRHQQVSHQQWNTIRGTRYHIGYMTIYHIYCDTVFKCRVNATCVALQSLISIKILKSIVVGHFTGSRQQKYGTLIFGQKVKYSADQDDCLIFIYAPYS